MIGLLLILLLQNPDSVISRIGIDQRLGSPIDPAITLRDEHGRPIRLGDLFAAGRPFLLTPVYYECPMLCSVQLNALARAMKVMPLTPGKDFDIITFSIDPNETSDLALAKKEQYVRDYGKPGASAGWHFLTGDPDSVKHLTDNIGFHYTVDPATGQYAHASTLLTLTPEGRLSQYFFGIEYDPGDLKYSLIQASGGKIGSLLEHALLYCYQYDPSTGKYSLAILKLIRLGGVATILGLVVFAARASRQRRWRV
jgi:protein SCO1